MEWRKSVGENVAEDEVIAVVETDKVSVDVRSTHVGVVVKLFAAVDDVVSAYVYMPEFDLCKFCCKLSWVSCFCLFYNAAVDYVVREFQQRLLCHEDVVVDGVIFFVSVPLLGFCVCQVEVGKPLCTIDGDEAAVVKAKIQAQHDEEDANAPAPKVPIDLRTSTLYFGLLSSRCTPVHYVHSMHMYAIICLLKITLRVNHSFIVGGFTFRLNDTRHAAAKLSSGVASFFFALPCCYF